MREVLEFFFFQEEQRGTQEVYIFLIRKFLKHSFIHFMDKVNSWVECKLLNSALNAVERLEELNEEIIIMRYMHYHRHNK